jgi:hypothetical protein
MLSWLGKTNSGLIAGMLALVLFFAALLFDAERVAQRTSRKSL